MKLDINIQNFGTVDNVDIALRPFTIISGPNGSGKSFITKALYSIFHELNNDILLENLRGNIETLSRLLALIEKQLIRPSKQDTEYLAQLTTILKDAQKMLQSIKSIQMSNIRLLGAIITEPFESFVNILTELTQSLQDKPTKYASIEVQIHSLREIAINLKNFSEEYKKSYESALTKNIKKGLLENFQIKSLRELINFYNPGKDAIFNFTHCDRDGKDQKLEFGRFTISAERGNISYQFRGRSIDELKARSRIVYIESPIYWKLKRALQSVRLDSLIQSRTHDESLLLGVPQHFYDLLDYLNQEFILEGDDESRLHQLLQNIEQSIGGRLQITQYGDIVFRHIDQGVTINLNATASGIVNLGIIGMLLEKRVLVSQGVLFIDEPEVNLHPEWQHFMIEILFELSKLGINVVIATHSIDMIYKLENILLTTTEYANKNFVGVNYITKDGKTPLYKQTESEQYAIFDQIKYIKNDLGKPYAQLYKSNIPKLRGGIE